MDAPKEAEDFPEKLARAHLPEPLKDTCLVLPKRLFQWASFNVMLIGIGIGMLLSALLGELVPVSSLLYGFPICLGIAWVICRMVLVKAEKKFYADVIGDEGGMAGGEEA